MTPFAFSMYFSFSTLPLTQQSHNPQPHPEGVGRVMGFPMGWDPENRENASAGVLGVREEVQGEGQHTSSNPLHFLPWSYCLLPLHTWCLGSSRELGKFVNI